MGRRGPRPEIRYWQRQGGGYFTTIKGKQVCLALGPDDGPAGPTYQKAHEAFGRLWRENTYKGTNGYPVADLLNAYRQKLADNGQDGMLRSVNYNLASFAELHGSKTVGELAGHHVRDWLRSQTTWGPSTKRTAIDLLLCALSFGAKDGLIQSNPLKGKVDLPESTPRGRDSRLSPTLADLLLKYSSPNVRDYLFFLRETGARPEEGENATAEHYRPGRFVMPWSARGGYVHKQARLGMKIDRTIFLTQELDDLVVKLVRQHKTGPLFRSANGNAFGGMVRTGFWKHLLGKRPIREYLAANNIPRKAIVPYSFRHTWASDFLDKGGSIKLCADLLGTSVAMIEKHYAHPDHDNLQSVYLAFMARR